MAHITVSPWWRFGMRHSRIVCMVWSDKPRHAQRQREKLAYAQSLGKPIRLVCVGATRLPEDICAGYGDVQVAHVRTHTEAGWHLLAWLKDYPPKEESP